MKRGLYTAATGMNTQMQRMDVISNNLANVNTTGYKRDDATIRSFDDIYLERVNEPKNAYGSPYFNDVIGDLGFGVTIDKVTTDFTTGSHIMTSGSLDFAIDGDAFFTIGVPNSSGELEEHYTRNGSFKLTSDGVLVNTDGYVVLGQDGPITLSLDEEAPAVSPSGELVRDGEVIDKLNIVAFEDNTKLRKVTDNFYTTTEEANFTTPSFSVRQGYLEGSNVNSVEEMVELIALSRNYETNQKVIQTQDTIMGKVATEVGRKQ